MFLHCYYLLSFINIINIFSVSALLLFTKFYKHYINIFSISVLLLFSVTSYLIVLGGIDDGSRVPLAVVICIKMYFMFTIVSS